MKFDDEKHFMFECLQKISTSRIYFYTYFLGLPEEAKRYFFKLELKATKNGPTIKRKASVISACISQFTIGLHPDVIIIPLSDIRAAISISSGNFKIYFKVQVVKNDELL